MQKGALMYCDTCGLLLSTSEPEYKCSTVFLGRIYRHEQADPAYKWLFLSVQRSVEEPGLKISVVFIQYEMPTTYRE